MKVIGHRGAAGLALENTLESIRAAKEAGVDAIEIDIRLTADGHFVLSHDSSVARVSEHEHVIKEVTSEHIDSIILSNGEKLPTLVEALKIIGDTPVVLEPKSDGWAKALASFLHKHSVENASVIAFDHDELKAFSKLAPQIATYSLERTRALDVIQFARRHRFTGIDLNFWILNPLTYWLARRRHLEIIVYTVNSRWIALFLGILFPHIAITTNYPDRMQFLRRHLRHK